MSSESNYTVAMLTLQSPYPPCLFVILRADMLTSYRTNATPQLRVAANDSVQRITVF